MRSGMLYKGRVLFFLDGKLYHEEDNMVVDAGLNLASNLLFTTTTNAQVTHMGLGSGTTAEAPTQTTLVTPLMISGSVQRKVFDAAPTRAGAVTTINCTFAPGQATGSVLGDSADDFGLCATKGIRRCSDASWCRHYHQLHFCAWSSHRQRQRGRLVHGRIGWYHVLAYQNRGHDPEGRRGSSCTSWGRCL
ncbi:hypothetical protein [Achromobacter phage ewik_TL4]|nr:hypothetical protein [Achromobacter phage ewik_TL4]